MAKDRERSNDAMRFLKQIKNMKFCLHLSGTADIYNSFGRLVNEVQKVNVLPYERLDNANKVLDHMCTMVKHVNHCV